MRIDALVKQADAIQKVAPKLEKLKKSAQGVEAMFVKDLLSAMRKSVPETSGQSGYGGDVFKDMFDQAFADAMGQSGSLGIGKMIYATLAKAVLAQSDTPQNSNPTDTKA